MSQSTATAYPKTKPTKRGSASVAGGKARVISTGKVAQRSKAASTPRPKAAPKSSSKATAASKAKATATAATKVAAKFKPTPKATSQAAGKQSTREAGKAARIEAAAREAKAQKVQSRTRISLPKLHRPSPAAAKRVAVGIAIVLVAFAVVYSPLRALYAARRDEQILTAKLEQVNASNEYLQDSVSTIQTREGIENEARRRGYVENGETAVTVEGLDTSDNEFDTLTSDDTTTPPTPWYIQIFDGIFQYTPTA